MKQKYRFLIVLAVFGIIAGGFISFKVSLSPKLTLSDATSNLELDDPGVGSGIPENIYRRIGKYDSTINTINVVNATSHASDPFIATANRQLAKSGIETIGGSELTDEGVSVVLCDAADLAGSPVCTALRASLVEGTASVIGAYENAYAIVPNKHNPHRITYVILATDTYGFHYGLNALLGSFTREGMKIYEVRQVPRVRDRAIFNNASSSANYSREEWFEFVDQIIESGYNKLDVIVTNRRIHTDLSNLGGDYPEGMFERTIGLFGQGDIDLQELVDYGRERGVVIVPNIGHLSQMDLGHFYDYVPDPSKTGSYIPLRSESWMFPNDYTIDWRNEQPRQLVRDLVASVVRNYDVDYVSIWGEEGTNTSSQIHFTKEIVAAVKAERDGGTSLNPDVTVKITLTPVLWNAMSDDRYTTGFLERASALKSDVVSHISYWGGVTYNVGGVLQNGTYHVESPEMSPDFLALIDQHPTALQRENMSMLSFLNRSQFYAFPLYHLEYAKKLMQVIEQEEFGGYYGYFTLSPDELGKAFMPYLTSYLLWNGSPTTDAQQEAFDARINEWMVARGGGVEDDRYAEYVKKMDTAGELLIASSPNQRLRVKDPQERLAEILNDVIHNNEEFVADDTKLRAARDMYQQEVKPLAIAIDDERLVREVELMLAVSHIFMRANELANLIAERKTYLQDNELTPDAIDEETLRLRNFNLARINKIINIVNQYMVAIDRYREIWYDEQQQIPLPFLQYNDYLPQFAYAPYADEFLTKIRYDYRDDMSIDLGYFRDVSVGENLYLEMELFDIDLGASQELTFTVNGNVIDLGDIHTDNTAWGKRIVTVPGAYIAQDGCHSFAMGANVPLLDKRCNVLTIENNIGIKTSEQSANEERRYAKWGLRNLSAHTNPPGFDLDEDQKSEYGYGPFDRDHPQKVVYTLPQVFDDVSLDFALFDIDRKDEVTLSVNGVPVVFDDVPLVDQQWSETQTVVIPRNLFSDTDVNTLTFRNTFYDGERPYVYGVRLLSVSQGE